MLLCVERANILRARTGPMRVLSSESICCVFVQVSTVSGSRIEIARWTRYIELKVETVIEIKKRAQSSQCPTSSGRKLVSNSRSPHFTAELTLQQTNTNRPYEATLCQ
ncbi:hypothetical protein EVAR_62990_1 [Eumeta japonica]|uniref:Uncharacterized protein n=1 Tax=Eumeta variegata TaxID=151549 RepID=A0A4C1ZPC9_EUMVA|nr:hypothetical protein EVAR_62990_1 [Eumeta japonica]